MKAYIHLEMEEIDGDVHITSKGNGDPGDLIMLIAYLYQDRPDYVLTAMSDEIQSNLVEIQETMIN